MSNPFAVEEISSIEVEAGDPAPALISTCPLAVLEIRLIKIRALGIKSFKDFIRRDFK
jgi:hypothetical protein